MKKSKVKKFIDLDISQCQIKFKIWKSISFLNEIKLVSNEESDFFIILNGNGTNLYNKINLSLIEKLDKYSNCIIIDKNTLFIEKYNASKNTWEILTKLNNRFSFLKKLNVGDAKVMKIFKYENNKLIFCTFKGIQIWNSINGIPDCCISILKIEVLSCFLMNNSKILVINERRDWFEEKRVSFWEINKLRKIFYYEAEDDDVQFEVKKINEDKIILTEINLEKSICNCFNCFDSREYCKEIGETFRESIIVESFYYSSIIKVPEFDEIYDFNKEISEEINIQGNIILFNKKNIFLGVNYNYIVIYDLNNYVELEKYQINNIFHDIQKIGEDTFGLISSDFEDNYKIEFFKIL